MDYSEWHLLNVYLDLNELGLGMSIRGGVDSADGQGNTDVYISKILEGGAVQQDGRLRIGDILLEVNGVSLQDITHKEVVQAIMKAAPFLHLYVKRRKNENVGDDSRRANVFQEEENDDDNDDDDEEEDEPLMGDRGDDHPQMKRPLGRLSKPSPSTTTTDFTTASSSLITVPLTRDAHNGFGFSLTGGVGNQLAPNDPAIYVSKLVHDGPAHRCGQIQVGDQIVAVNGTQLTKVPYQWALQLIRSSPPSSSFTVRKALTWD